MIALAVRVCALQGLFLSLLCVSGAGTVPAQLPRAPVINRSCRRFLFPLWRENLMKNVRWTTLVVALGLVAGIALLAGDVLAQKTKGKTRPALTKQLMKGLVFPNCGDLKKLLDAERKVFFLPPEPPAWCVEMAKWPYGTPAWKQWLADKRAGRNPPLPAAQ